MGYGSCIVCVGRNNGVMLLKGMDMFDAWCTTNHAVWYAWHMMWLQSLCSGILCDDFCEMMYCVINVAFGIACMACDIWCIICVYIKRVCVTLYMTRDNGCIFDACCQNFGWWFLCDVWRLVEIECVHDDAVFFSRYGSLLMDAHTDALYPRGMVWGLFSMHVCEVCGQDAWYLMHYVLCMHGLWCLKFTYYDMCDVWWCLMCVFKTLYVWVWSSQC